ncbi:MAG: polysulfide reductase NrfD [Deltaproteobacteria bacterium]|nr:polysulfide reductase NrfD [Deltaproteobacteria bacterium]
MRYQTSRQWMITHEWMVKPMQQKEWIEKQGILVWLSEVFSALGTGLYLIAIFVDSWWGALAGYLIVMLLKLPLHLIYLGKPLRFWRTMPPFSGAWRTSWIARGVVFTVLFSMFGFAQLITSYILGSDFLASGQAHNMVYFADVILKVVAGFFVILTGIYCGFMMSYCKSVPFWNTGILPIVILNAGIADGLALVMGIGLLAGGVGVYGPEYFHNLEYASRIVLGVNAVLLGTYLMNASYQSSTAELSVKELLVGRVAIIFWLGIVLFGIIMPLAISFISMFTGDVTTILLVAAIIGHTAGAFALKYCILKVGIYKPILPKSLVF